MSVKEILKRWKSAQAHKEPWHTLWDDLARVQLPTRMGFSTTLVSGERRTDDIYDGTPMQGARGLANAIGGLMRPEGLPQINMRAEDDRINDMDEAKEWFDDANARLLNAFNNPKARFRQSSAETDLDLVVFGTAGMYIGEKNNHLTFQSHHLKDFTPLFDEDGTPMGMFFKRKLAIYQLVRMFGLENLSEDTRKGFKDNPDQRIEILHAVLPREGKSNALLSKNFPWSDTWIEIKAMKELRSGGYHEFPFVVPRWDTTSGEDFGSSPGMIALPDSDTLQAMGETLLIAGQRAADPPIMAPNDGSFDALNTFPGGLGYYDIETAQSVGGNPFFPLVSGTNLPITRDMQDDARSQVFAAFFRNVLNLPTEGPEMTATEVMQRKEEFIREIGPTFGKLETDYTAPMVERAFMIMLRANAFLPIPEVLQGQNIKFEYDSPVKRIRQQIEATAAKMWVGDMIELSEFKPEALDRINIDEYAKFSAEALDIPRKIVNSDELVKTIRDARNQAMAAQEEVDQAMDGLEMMNMGAEVVQKGEKNGSLDRASASSRG